LPSQKGPSGFFRMEKTGGRWNLVSPQGNVFFLQAVFNANEGFIEPQSCNNATVATWISGPLTGASAC